mgnify:CR=1 FL=1
MSFSMKTIISGFRSALRGYEIFSFSDFGIKKNRFLKSGPTTFLEPLRNSILSKPRSKHLVSEEILWLLDSFWLIIGCFEINRWILKKWDPLNKKCFLRSPRPYAVYLRLGRTWSPMTCITLCIYFNNSKLVKMRVNNLFYRDYHILSGC